MKITVKKNGVIHDCTSDQQLRRFLEAGYVKCRPPKKDGAAMDGKPDEEPADEE